jgi:hypothetical protein
MILVAVALCYPLLIAVGLAIRIVVEILALPFKYVAFRRRR